MSHTTKPSPASTRKKVTKTANGRPAMAGGNAISQAVKPSRSPINLPSMPGSVVPIEQHEAVLSELEQKKKELVQAEKRHARNQARIEKQEAMITRARNALQIMGISDSAMS